MQTWTPNEKQNTQYEKDGYFIVPGLLSRDAAMQIKGVILDHVLQPDIGEEVGADIDPANPETAMDAMARAARFRKLGGLGLASPLIWQTFFVDETLMSIARYFLDADNVVMKWNSCFMKPARTGSSTPWHQDNGLWRDGDMESMNVWMAVDPATKENGCLQFMPGSHRQNIIHTHVLYEDSIHGELPRDVVKNGKETFGVHHIELNPGDAVVWHSNLYHYSPPNHSAQSRIGIAGVFSDAEQARRNPLSRQYRWCMQNGIAGQGFPPEPLEGYTCEAKPYPPYPKADEMKEAS